MKPSYYKKLFKKYGLTPKRGYYLRKLKSPEGTPECEACALGLRFVHAMKSLEAAGEPLMTSYPSMLDKLWINADMPEQFAKGLDTGWESWSGINHYEGENADYDAGFIEGRAAALVLLGD